MKKIIDATITRTRMADRIAFTGFIPDVELDSLLRRAAMLVYPSFYEGFGLPVLESMKCGTPVVTSNTSSMPEVGGQACLYADPYDLEDLADKIYSMISNSELKTESWLSLVDPFTAAPFYWDVASNLTDELWDTYVDPDGSNPFM